jgi:hypothetical protein
MQTSASLIQESRRTPAAALLLLDTSAVIAFSRSDLQGFDPRPLLSPFTCCELLCHLEEDFQRWKSMLLKCRETTILDDPTADQSPLRCRSQGS